MKKLLGSAFALAMLIPYSPAAYADTLLNNLSFSGQIDMLGVSANNVTDLNTAKDDQIGDAETRILLNANWDVLDNVHAVVTLGNNSLMGGEPSSPYFGGMNPGSNNLIGAAGAGNGLLNNVYVDQAYLKIDKLFGAVDTTLGRQYYGHEGDLVVYFGPESMIYGLPVTALDAARFDWTYADIGATGVVGKVAGTVASNIDITGLELHLTKELGDLGVTNAMSDVGLTGVHADVFGYNREIHNDIGTAATSGGIDSLFVYGLRAKANVDGVEAHVTFAQDSGSNRLAYGYPYPAATGILPHAGNYDAQAVIAHLGYKADTAAGTVHPWAEGALGTAGFQAINSDYHPGDIYGMFTSAGMFPGAASLGGANLDTGLDNRELWGAGVKYTPEALTKLTGGVSYWDYYWHQLAGDTYYGGTGVQATGGGNDHIGSEIDVDLTWKETDNVSLNGGWGTFQPGGYITVNNLGHVNPVSLLYADVQVKF